MSESSPPRGDEGRPVPTFAVALARDGARVVSVRGELDLAAAPTLAAALLTIAPSDGQVIVDLAGVEFVDAGGMRVLHEWAAAAVDPSATLILNPSDRVRRVFQLADLAHLLDVAHQPSTVRTVSALL